MSKKPTGFDADFFVPDAERDPHRCPQVAAELVVGRLGEDRHRGGHPQRQLIDHLVEPFLEGSGGRRVDALPGSGVGQWCAHGSSLSRHDKPAG